MTSTSRPPLPHGYPQIEGYARLAVDPLHGSMRAFADDFLERNRDTLRDYAAHWVADPLRHWSRRWEYPYVFEQLSDWAQSAGRPRSGLRILDAGSGLTFFPHYVATRLGVESVDCCDRDPAMERDAAKLEAPADPRVRYSTRDLTDLGFPAESFDCTYCISVLEHTAERERIVDEFARTLRPGGLLVVTIDVSLDGRAEIPRDEAARLISALQQRFQPLDDFGEAISRPPEDTITTLNVGNVEPALAPPRTYASAGGVLRRLMKPHTFPWRRAFRRLLGGASGTVPSELSFFCTAWVKPGTSPVAGA